MSITRQFKFNIPTFQKLLNPNYPIQPINIQNKMVSPTRSFSEYFIVERKPDWPLNAYFAFQSHGAPWAELQKVERIVPIKNVPTNPQFVLTTPFEGCSWIFGITKDNLLIYHDRNPKDDLKGKTDGIKAKGATSILRFDHIEVSQDHKLPSTWTYAQKPQGETRIATALAYLQFENNGWNLHIQDTWAVAIPTDYVPQDKN